jgi:hypothetical protein
MHYSDILSSTARYFGTSSDIVVAYQTDSTHALSYAKVSVGWSVQTSPPYSREPCTPSCSHSQVGYIEMHEMYLLILIKKTHLQM